MIKIEQAKGTRNGKIPNLQEVVRIGTFKQVRVSKLMQLKHPEQLRGKNGDHTMHLPSDKQFTSPCQSGGTGGAGAEFEGKGRIPFWPY